MVGELADQWALVAGLVGEPAASKPGVGAKQRDYELELAKAENARLGEALKEMAVKLMLIEEKTVGAEWPSSCPGRRPVANTLRRPQAQSANPATVAHQLTDDFRATPVGGQGIRCKLLNSPL